MKIAVIATTWHPLSHADVIVTRWVRPYPSDAAHGWGRPGPAIASVHLDQITGRDIGQRFCRRNGIPLYGSLEEALTLGGDRLAVDAVLLIAEHGDYPLNEFGQKLYPRKAFLDRIAAVFRASGRSVPVFNDKHLSWDLGEAREMVATAHELGFSLYAGSSLPHCPLDPGPPVEEDETIAEALALFRGGAEGYGYHSMEFLLSLTERRRGGECGIRAVRVLEGERLRDAIATGELPHDLLHAALLRQGYPDREEIVPFVLERLEEGLIYQLEHFDRLRATHLLMPKVVSGWTAAVRNAAGTVRSCSVKSEGACGFFANFAHLNRQIERFFRTGTPPSPLSRTVLAGGAIQALLRCRKLRPGQWCPTPELGPVREAAT